MHSLATIYSVSSLSSELIKLTPAYSLLLVVFLPIVLFPVVQYMKYNLYSEWSST